MKTIEELQKKNWYKNALPSEQDDMQSFALGVERVAREEVVAQFNEIINRDYTPKPGVKININHDH